MPHIFAKWHNKKANFVSMVLAVSSSFDSSEESILDITANLMVRLILQH